VSFQLAMPDARVITFDTANFLREVVAAPGQYGFDVADAACTENPTCVFNPLEQDRYLFWDGVHPTTAAHAQLGLAFATTVANAVPEPSSLVLALFALSLVVGAARRKV